MKINIYYGGRGLIEDPTICVMNKMTEVLEELRVEVTRYNLYEQKNSISMLPNTLKEADGIILAVNVEWMGIGGYMQQFLDACWLYGDKQKIQKLSMFPVVTANTYGEREAELHLKRSWEVLGGTSLDGIIAYVENPIDFEVNTSYAGIFERKAESLYRFINQKSVTFSSSSHAVMKNTLATTPIELTPQESEQLSMYVSDDTYVKKQKEDIEELAQMFRGMLENSGIDKNQEFIKNFKDNFKPQEEYFKATFSITMTDTDKTLFLEVTGNQLKCSYGDKIEADVIAKTTREMINRLVNGRTTFQGAFMSGELTAKGDFKILRKFDQIFHFSVLS